MKVPKANGENVSEKVIIDSQIEEYSDKLQNSMETIRQAFIINKIKDVEAINVMLNLSIAIFEHHGASKEDLIAFCKAFEKVLKKIGANFEWVEREGSLI
jgi:hypothetical protein